MVRVQKVTAIIPCWKRLENLDKVISSWLNQEEIDEVIVFDNSGKFRTKLKDVLVISSGENLGPQAKFPCAQFAKNDIILYSDDDVAAKPGLIADLMKYYDDDGMVGVMGKNFTGPTYYEATGFRGENITQPVEVDYLCGLIMLMHRRHTFVDSRKCPSRHMDDWWLQQEVGLANMVHRTGHSALIVAPTNKYEIQKENYDENALHLMPELKELREKYFEEWVASFTPLKKDYNRNPYKRPFDQLLVNKKCLTGVEVGVYRGQHAREMLELLDIETLYLVDPWRDYEGYDDKEISGKVGNAIYDAQRLLWPYLDWVIWMREFSIVAADSFDDESLDFVYIDASHDYEHVIKDIERWTPKVKPGGIVGGHDYIEKFPGVRKAVDEYCQKNNIPFKTMGGNLFPYYNENADWAFRKDGEIKDWNFISADKE